MFLVDQACFLYYLEKGFFVYPYLRQNYQAPQQFRSLYQNSQNGMVFFYPVLPDSAFYFSMVHGGHEYLVCAFFYCLDLLTWKEIGVFLDYVEGHWGLLSNFLDRPILSLVGKLDLCRCTVFFGVVDLRQYGVVFQREQVLSVHELVWGVWVVRALV